MAEDGAQALFNDTWLLSTGENPSWELADVMGDVPVARWRHTATLLPDNASLLVFGGLAKCAHARGEVFDVFVDKAKKDFTSWSEIVPELSYDSATTTMSLVTVPTMETVAVSFWIDNLLPNKHAAMLVGSAGCGKTALINGKLRVLSDDFASETVNINYYTNSNMFQKIIEAPLEKKAGKNYGPPGNKKLIFFVDDLNMAALDAYNTASNISLMRQHMGYGHIYDMGKLSTRPARHTSPCPNPSPPELTPSPCPCTQVKKSYSEY